MSERYIWPVLIVVLVFCGAVICWTWNRPALTEQQSGLIRSLAESVLMANKSPTPIRVALFDAKLDGGEATKDLKDFLSTDVTGRVNSGHCGAR